MALSCMFTTPHWLFSKTLEAPFSLVKNQTFNVGSNEQNYTIYQIGMIINQFVPAAQIVDQGPDTDRRNYRVNFNKIRDILGFCANVGGKKGVAQVIEAIESGKIMDYRDPRYSNVKFLGNERASRLALQNGWAEELIKCSAVCKRGWRLTRNVRNNRFIDFNGGY